MVYRTQSSRDPIGSVKQQMKDRLGFGDSQLTRVVPLTDYAFDGAGVWPLDEDARACASDRHPVPAAAVADAEGALDALEFDRARAIKRQPSKTGSHPMDGARTPRKNNRLALPQNHWRRRRGIQD